MSSIISQRLMTSTAARTLVANNTNNARLLSTRSTAAVDGLKSVLEEYRQRHYTYEVPMRFKKEIVAAAVSSQQPAASTTLELSVARSLGAVRFEGMQQVLSNIGMDDRVNQGDLKNLFQEEGDADGAISADRMIRLI